MREKPIGPSQRQLKVGEEIRHILATVFARGNSYSDVLNNASLTVSEVRVSPDLKNATVYVMPLGGIKVPEVMKELKTHSAFFRSHVARQMHLKATPRLTFRADDSFEEAAKIEKLLQNVNVKRDLITKEQTD